MVRESSVVTKGDVFFLPLLVQAFAAALVQVPLLERYGPAAAQLTGGQAPVLVLLLGRVEKVGPPPGLPGSGRRGTGRGQVFGHRQPVERAVHRLRHVVVVQRDGQLQRLTVQRGRQVGPEHGLLERGATVVRGRGRAAAASVDWRRRRRGLGEGPGTGGGRWRRRRVMVVIVGRGRRPDRRGGQGRRRGAPRVRQAAGGRRQPLLNDLLASCGDTRKRDYSQCVASHHVHRIETIPQNRIQLFLMGTRNIFVTLRLGLILPK